MKLKSLMLLGGVVLALSGCMNMSGLDAKSDFGCKAPDGVLCESMSGIYANAQAQNLPGQRVNRHAGDAPAPVDLSQAKGVMTKPMFSGTPIRSAPRILRVWFSPWEDSDGDLHDQSYVYLPVDSGRWVVEHNRRRIQESYRPVRAPTQQAVPEAAPAAKGAQALPVSQGELQGQPGDVAVGARQERVSNAQAMEFLNGVVTPADVLPQNQ